MRDGLFKTLSRKYGIKKTQLCSNFPLIAVKTSGKGLVKNPTDRTLLHREEKTFSKYYKMGSNTWRRSIVNINYNVGVKNMLPWMYHPRVVETLELFTPSYCAELWSSMQSSLRFSLSRCLLDAPFIHRVHLTVKASFKFLPIKGSFPLSESERKSRPMWLDQKPTSSQMVSSEY